MIYKAFRVTPSLKVACSLAFGVLLLLLFIVNPANSAFQCTICPQDSFCTGGEVYLCSTETNGERPVTTSTGAKKIDECKTCDEVNIDTPVFDGAVCVSCYQNSKNNTYVTHVWSDSEDKCVTCATANSNTPVFSDEEGEHCISCYQANASKPYWNGTTCVACNKNEEWTQNEDTNMGSCGCKNGYYEELVPEGSIPIYNSQGAVEFYLHKDMVFASTTSVTKEKCLEMAASEDYPEITLCNDENDYWVGAMKQCKEQGKRLPTLQELAYIAQTLYGESGFEGFTDPSNNSNLQLVQTALWEILLSAGVSYGSGQDSDVTFWSNYQIDDSGVGGRLFMQNHCRVGRAPRNYSNIKAFCLDI